MFSEADLDIKKRCKSDPALNSLVTLAKSNYLFSQEDNSGKEQNNFETLAAVFHEKGMNKGDHLEISKQDFISVLKDSGILIIQKVEAKAEEGKGKAAKPDAKKEGEEAKEAPARKFDEADVRQVIADACSFDDD